MLQRPLPVTQVRVHRGQVHVGAGVAFLQLQGFLQLAGSGHQRAGLVHGQAQVVAQHRVVRNMVNGFLDEQYGIINVAQLQGGEA